jgi:hypothetical protein
VQRAAVLRRRRIVWWATRVTLIAGVAVGFYLGGREALRRLVWENPDLRLREITVEHDGRLTRPQILEAAGLHEGMNVFALNLSRQKCRIIGHCAKLGNAFVIHKDWGLVYSWPATCRFGKRGLRITGSKRGVLDRLNVVRIEK